MAEAVKKPSRVVDTWKQKKWYRVVSPQMFGARDIGETIASDESLLIGRTVKVSLAAITGDMKKQSTSAIFEIDRIEGGNAATSVKRLEISPSSIRRMMRKGKDRIDLSIVCATKDNLAVRVKPFLVTRGKVGNSILTSIRKLVDAVLRNEINKVGYEALVREVVSGNLQRKIRQRANRIYPLRTVEIRSVEKTVYTKSLPPIPELPEFREAVPEETEEEKVVKKAKSSEEKPAESEESKEAKPKKTAVKKPKEKQAEENSA